MGLEDHLVAWLGAWPPTATVDVVGASVRTEPGWDGQVRPLLGVESPDLGMLLSVPPDRVEAVYEIIASHGGRLTPAAGAQLAVLLGGDRVGAGVLRRAEAVPGPDVLPDVGTWTPSDDPAVPPWLRPFNGGVLLVRDGDGAYAAGLGVKRHDAVGHELSVGTEPEHRDRGLARRLVAQAARRLLTRGATVTYLHGPDNTASARVAEAAGFPDRGWRVWGLFRDTPEGT